MTDERKTEYLAKYRATLSEVERLRAVIRDLSGIDPIYLVETGGLRLRFRFAAEFCYGARWPSGPGTEYGPYDTLQRLRLVVQLLGPTA